MQHVVGARRITRITPTQARIDPVALTMLAVNRLAPATLRTVTDGRALTIAVPDAQVAEIFRAALVEMQKARRTDRLIDVVVTQEPATVKPIPLR
jgi:hypothetical protein